MRAIHIISIWEFTYRVDERQGEMSVERSTTRLQNIISLLVITLLVTQTFLLVLVLFDLKAYKQLLLSSAGSSQADPVELLVGTQAPDFHLSDEKGATLSLADFAGSPILLVFTSHECRYCQEMYPALKQFVEIESDIQIFTLSVNSIDENIEFQKEFNLIGHGNLHILSATPEIFEKYSIIGTPTFVAIDGKGVIVGTGSVGTLKQIVELTNEIR